MAKPTIKDTLAQLEREKIESDKMIGLLERQEAGLNNLFNVRKKIAVQQEIANEQERIANRYEEEKNNLLGKGYKLNSANMKILTEQTNKVQAINKTYQVGNERAQRRLVIYNGINSAIKGANNLLIKQNLMGVGFIKTLNEQDKIIRQTILNLGMSGYKADQMRTSFEDSAMAVAQLGGSLADIQAIQQGFADETGRARTMTKQMVIDVAEIGFGTGLGIENATLMASQFEIMGIDAARTKNVIQTMVDNGQRFGINSKKAMTELIKNFSKLNSTTFQGGVKSMASMALYSQQMKVNMSAALDSAEAARTLEGAIDLAAQLQVMGGEFAKTDPFELLFLSRNDPEQYQKKISEMTQSVITFRKMSDGTFQKFISPADIDRLGIAGKALGFTKDQMVEMAQRTADMTKMGSELMGTGLTSKQKELIKGAAIFNTKTGTFEVQIGEQLKRISELSANDAKLFENQKSSLEARAKASQDFETALKATIDSFKTILLPMLRGFNTIIEWARPIFESIAGGARDLFGKGFMKSVGLLSASILLFNVTARAFTQSFLGSGIINSIKGRGFFGGRTTAPTTAPVGGGGTGGGRFAGKGLMNGGIGAGAAALGIGAGIGLAASGISLLANSLNRLDEKKIDVLKSITKTLGWFVVGGAVASASILAFAASGALAAAPLTALGAALTSVGAGVALIGGGIGAATAGIGYMAKGISTSLKGNPEDYVGVEKAIRSISTMTVSKDSALGKLASLFDKPLKVEFSDKNVNLNTEISLVIDGEKFMRKVVTQKRILQIINNT